ncbi:spermine synthase-like, partial [Saccoglossus kowalevskii]|uniref:Spermine synthase-like n=1 Tax=Saccoglossus kowalevskii TaxID=10224 RepID=A0ABM0MGI3_SACKO
HATVRGYIHGLVTIDVQNENNDKLSKQTTEDIQMNIKKLLNCHKTKRFPAIQRGGKIDRYVPTAVDLLVEYDFDECVYETNSPYQNIKIMHSQQFGNMLLLDDDP